MNLLVADIGGTNARFAIITPDDSSYSHFKKLRCDDFKTLVEAINYYLKDIGAVPVLASDNVLIGILSERDIVRKLVKTGRDSDLVTASDIMTKDIKSINLNTSVVEAQKIMTQNNIRHLPVVDANNKLINFLSQRDLIIDPAKKKMQYIIVSFFLLIFIAVFIMLSQ